MSRRWIRDLTVADVHEAIMKAPPFGSGGAEYPAFAPDASAVRGIGRTLFSDNVPRSGRFRGTGTVVAAQVKRNVRYAASRNLVIG